MFLRKALVCFCFLLAAPLVLSACRNDFEFDESRVIYRSFDQSEAYIEHIYDMQSLPGAIELSDLIILGTITQKTDVDATVTPWNGATFEYEITVDSIYYDRRGTVRVGDSVMLTSGCGYMLCTEFHRLALYEEIPDYEFAENEYYVFNLYGMLPYEVGRQFVIFLDDSRMDTVGTYVDGSYAQNWCLENGKLYYGAEATRWDGDPEDLTEMIALALSERSGKLDD